MHVGTSAKVERNRRHSLRASVYVLTVGGKSYSHRVPADVCKAYVKKNKNVPHSHLCSR